MMTRRSLVVGCLATAVYVSALYAQTARPQPAPATPQPRQAQPATAKPNPASPTQPRPTAAVTPAAPAVSVEDQKAFLTQYCVGCHSEKMKAAGLDSSRRLTM